MSTRFESVAAEALRACGIDDPEKVEVPEIVAALKAAQIGTVELPKSPSEYWGPNHDPQWNHYPFTRVDGDEIEIGARCEHVFRTNVIEARVFAADVLAAADVAEAAR